MDMKSPTDSGQSRQRPLTPDAVAECLEVSTATLARWRCLETGPDFVRVGGRVRCRGDALDAFLAAGENKVRRRAS